LTTAALHFLNGSAISWAIRLKQTFYQNSKDRERKTATYLIIVALGLGLRKREQLNLRRDQVDFSRNVVIAARTKGRKNREIPMDVLNPEVRNILLKLCDGKKPDDYVFENLETGKPFTDIKRLFQTACRMVGIENLWWHDLRATFCTRLALARYEALTIMMLRAIRI
jgi:integrase